MSCFCLFLLRNNITFRVFCSPLYYSSFSFDKNELYFATDHVCLKADKDTWGIRFYKQRKGS